MHAADIVDNNGTVKCGVGGAPGDRAVRSCEYFRPPQFVVVTGVELAMTQNT
ncbi:hypothetical protein D3C86_2096240 [compost metagenome]